MVFFLKNQLFLTQQKLPNLSTSLERPCKELLNACLVLKFVTPNSNYKHSKFEKT